MKTSAGIILLDALYDYSVEDEIVGGLTKLGSGTLTLAAAVPPEELLPWVAAADVVAMPIQPTTLNHRLTTPNKLFEALAAGVPVVASDLPGMALWSRQRGSAPRTQASGRARRTVSALVSATRAA